MSPLVIVVLAAIKTIEQAYGNRLITMPDYPFIQANWLIKLLDF